MILCYLLAHLPRCTIHINASQTESHKNFRKGVYFHFFLFLFIVIYLPTWAECERLSFAHTQTVRNNNQKDSLRCDFYDIFAAFRWRCTDNATRWTHRIVNHIEIKKTSIITSSKIPKRIRYLNDIRSRGGGMETLLATSGRTTTTTTMTMTTTAAAAAAAACD